MSLNAIEIVLAAKTLAKANGANVTTNINNAEFTDPNSDGNVEVKEADG